MPPSISSQVSKILGIDITLSYPSFLRCPGCGGFNRFEVIAMSKAKDGYRELSIACGLCKHKMVIKTEMDPMVILRLTEGNKRSDCHRLPYSKKGKYKKEK